MPGQDPLQDRVYFSQNKEDLILESFFPDVEKGFYVDVGAWNPVVDSVTKLFYDKGWSGINIEPIKHHYQSLKLHRPRDINLNIGVSDKDGSLTFHTYKSVDGWSTFSEAVVKKQERENDEVSKNSQTYQVEVKTLKSIFTEHKVTKIHFLKIDVEGFEYEVLRGNDWDVYRPEVLCIEADHIVKDWRPMLKSNNYQLTFFDGLNEYYTDAKTDRASKFNYVDDVIIKKGNGIRYGDYELIETLNKNNVKLQDEINNTHRRLRETLAANAQTQSRYQTLLSENHQFSLRAAEAERALRRPMPFIKYQLKRLHRIAIHQLSKGKPVKNYTKEEQDQKARALSQLKHSTNDDQLLLAGQQLAQAETTRLQRLYRAKNRRPLLLDLYLKLIARIKRFRVIRAKQ